MESRSSSGQRAPAAQVIVSGPDGSVSATVELTDGRVTVGRLQGANDIALQPDPQLLVGRAGHCTLEHEDLRWFVVDGGSVNGTFLRRGGTLQPVSTRTALQDGDVICILGLVTESDERRFFELAFRSSHDPGATRAAPVVTRRPTVGTEDCLRYDTLEARLVLVRSEERHEIRIRAQAHQLVRHMAERNTEGGGSPVLCTYDELMRAVWHDEPMHTREELAKLVWELRRKLDPLGAAHLIETERGLGYRLRTCRSDEPR